MSDGSAAESDSERRGEHPLAGSVVGGTYRVAHRIGSGGIGHVYEAEHVRLGSKVAVKVLRTELGDRPLTLARFQQEARILAAIESDYVVRVLDCGELPNGAPYLTMELLRGEDLRARLKRVGRLSEEHALHVGWQACRGLTSVHAAGVVHRDLKPANLFLYDRGEDGERCKILDFGVAKALSASDVTREGTAPGTLRYMAPEQVLQSARPDARTDIYALGAILYEMLVGKPPHDGETAEELMFAIANRTPSPPHVTCDAVRPEVSAVVLRCLARSPAERFQSANELARVLKDLSTALARAGDAKDSLDATLPERTLEHDRPVAPRPPSLRPRNALLVGIVLGSSMALGAWNVLRARTTQPFEHVPSTVPGPIEPNPPAPAVATVASAPPAALAPTSSASASTTASSPVATSNRKPKTRGGAPKPSVEFGTILHQESPYSSQD